MWSQEDVPRIDAEDGQICERGDSKLKSPQSIPEYDLKFHKRSRQTVTVDQLEHFIADGVDTAVQQALKKIELAHQHYSDTWQDIDDLWGSLKQDLLELEIEEKEALANIQEEFMSYTKEMNITSMKDLKSVLKQEESNLSNNK